MHWTPPLVRSLWEGPIDSLSMVAFGNGVVYASAYPGIVMALDAESGDLQWRVQLPSQIRNAGVAKRISGGLSSPPFSSPAVHGHLTRPIVGHGMVFVGSDYEYFYALDAASGELVWAFETWGLVTLSPVLSDGILYFASTDEHVYALDAVTGSPIWHYYVELDASAIMVLDGVVFVNSGGQRVFALTEPEG